MTKGRYVEERRETLSKVDEWLNCVNLQEHGSKYIDQNYNILGRQQYFL